MSRVRLDEPLRVQVDEKPWREVPCGSHHLAKLLTSTILEIPVGRYLIALHPSDRRRAAAGCRAIQGQYLAECSRYGGSMATVGGGERLTGGAVSALPSGVPGPPCPQHRGDLGSSYALVARHLDVGVTEQFRLTSRFALADQPSSRRSAEAMRVLAASDPGLVSSNSRGWRATSPMRPQWGRVVRQVHKSTARVQETAGVPRRRS